MKYFIQTFGCQQNIADSQRLDNYYRLRGYTKAKNFSEANLVVINTCIVRQQAEDRVYGLVQNLEPLKEKKNFKIVITGCLVGAATREPSGKRMKNLRKMLPQVDEFLPIDEVGFEYPALRTDKLHALVPISNGCNNFCTYCIVPFSRGPERSRTFTDIIDEIKELAKNGYKEITLVGQNVNSYGADLVKSTKEPYQLPNGQKIKPIIVNHLGKKRIPTLFPYLLTAVCKIKGIKKISFISSNPWDFSDELIDVIAKNKKINRIIHLPVQAGDNQILKKMNRWYSRQDYLNLIKKIRKKVPNVKFTTDIIVGFPGETKKAFQNTMALAQTIGFDRAFIACYSPRIGTLAVKKYRDDVPHQEKMNRFHTLDKLINFRYRNDI